MPHSNSDSTTAIADHLRESIARHVRYTLVRSLNHLTPAELLVPVSLAVRDLFVDQMLRTSSATSEPMPNTFTTCPWNS